MTERKRRFARAYIRLANATKAALEAGYSEKTSHSQGHRLLRDFDIQRMIDASRINRGAHAEVTYSNLINLAQVALRHVQDCFTKRPIHDPEGKLLGEFAAANDEKARAIAAAAKTLEVLAKVEGLFVGGLMPISNVPPPGQENHYYFKIDFSKLNDAELNSYEELLAKIGNGARGPEAGDQADPRPEEPR